MEARKEGTTAYYHVRDPLLFKLLDVGKQIFNNHLISSQELLQQLSQEAILP